jgi:hypothetical protein
MKKVDFITQHVIQQIERTIEEKRKVTKQTSFYYFNEPIKDGSRIINRVSRFNPFEKEEICSISWYALSGSTLVQIYDKLKNNDFFFYKNIEGKSYKAKLKKNV